MSDHVLLRHALLKFPTATAFEPIHRGSYALLSSQTQNDQFKVRSTSVFVPLVRSYIQHKLAQWGISGERATSSSGSGSTPTINGKKK